MSLAVTFLAGTLLGTPRLLAQRACEDLKSLATDSYVEIVSAVMKPAEPLKRQNAPASAPVIMVPAHCQVAGIARPSSDSEIRFALWLPPAAAWNGKFMQRGNGGWAGGIPIGSLVTPLMRGYAVAATDDGHSSTLQVPDASFAIGHPEKLLDFGYRAVHQTSVQSRMLLRAFYGRPQSKSYFVGCSDGGREAMMEAQRFPEDFDGIVAGAPANNWVRHFAGFLWNERALNGAPGGILPVEKLPLLQKSVLAACDALDGVKDGVLEDPRKCRFDPGVLKCEAGDRPDCLTAAQVDAVKKIYAGPVDPRTGVQIYPGYEPGMEAHGGGWGPWILGGIQAGFGNTLFGEAVYENQKWDWHSFDLERDLRYAQEKVGAVLNAYNPDLRSFRAHGGKLIEYHGWGDAAIAPRDAIAYYEMAGKFLREFPDARASAPQPQESFYRLFMVPGLGHCTGGVGPVHFGNDEFPDPNVWPEDAAHDVVLALDRWVTQGVAPAQIIATGKIADPKDAGKTVTITRPLCLYPKVAHYKGSGDTNDAANFACVDSSAK